MNDREFWEALDAGAGSPRTGEGAEGAVWQELRSRLLSDDVATERARQVREFDDRVGNLLQDVELPSGLADRVRSALSQSATPPSGSILPSSPATSVAVHPSEDTAQPFPWKITRRQWVSLLATAACLGLLWMGFRARRAGDGPELTSSRIIGAAEQWMGRINDQTAWRQVTHLPTGRYKPSQAVAGTPLRFATLDTEWDGRTRLYEYPRQGQSEQWCFVFRPSETASQLAQLPPDQPSGGSGGWNTACWQEGPAVYVLMVRGSLDDYRRAVGPGRKFVSQPAQPIQLVVR
ncbi:MAG: hypothetical protein U0795_08515 [Pirellulales bacterium]